MACDRRKNFLVIESMGDVMDRIGPTISVLQKIVLAGMERRGLDGFFV